MYPPFPELPSIISATQEQSVNPSINLTFYFIFSKGKEKANIYNKNI